MKMSQVPSSVVAIHGIAAKTSSYEKANPAISPSISKPQQSMAMFSGAAIQGSNFSINIYTVNQSLSHQKRCHDGRDCGLWRTVTMSKNVAMI